MFIGGNEHLIFPFSLSLSCAREFKCFDEMKVLQQCYNNEEKTTLMHPHNAAVNLLRATGNGPRVALIIYFLLVRMIAIAIATRIFHNLIPLQR